MVVPREKNAPHEVVIVGGGFGGLYAAKALAKAKVNVTLIDKRNFHLFQLSFFFDRFKRLVQRGQFNA